MSEMPRFRFGDLLALVLVLVVAGGLRGYYLWFLADQAKADGPWLVQDPIPPVKDSAEAKKLRHESPNQLDLLVYNLKENKTFAGEAPFAAGSETTAHLSPGYPGLLSLIERAPIDSSLIDPGIRWFQCVLGTLTAVFYFFFARRAFHSLLVGVLAGLLCAANPFWIVNTAEINDGVLSSFLLGSALLLGSRASQQGGALTSLLYGVSLAALALTRAALLPFSLVALIWFLIRSRQMPRGWLYALLAFLGFGNALAPWTMRNYQTLGEFMPLVDSAYLHAWEGNNPQATGGPLSEQTMREALAKVQDDNRESLAKQLAEKKQTKRYNDLAPEVIKQVQENPAAFAQRRLNATLYFLVGESWFKEKRLVGEGASSNEEIPGWLSTNQQAILAGTILGLLLLGFIGWRWTYGWRLEAMPSSLAVLWIPLPYILTHAESFSGPRLPLDGVLLTYAAFVIACLVPPVGHNLFAGGDSFAKQEEK